MDSLEKRIEECSRIVLFLLETSDVANKIQYALMKHGLEMRISFIDNKQQNGVQQQEQEYVMPVQNSENN